MDESLIELVRTHAGSCCEYCLMPQAYYPAPFQIDHVIARQHDGATISRNLALSCLHCNSYKGPNIAGQNPRTGRRVRLFHHRKDRWSRHFAWQGPILVGRTVAGRVTIDLLEINRPEAVELREYLIREAASE